MNIENKKQIATILLAVGLGLVAAFLTSQYVQSAIQDQTKLLAGEYQKKSMVLVGELESMKKDLQTIATRQEQLAQQQRQVVMVQSQPQQQEKSPTLVGQFSMKTPPGKRAYTILIDSLSAVGGLINPGDFVDIIGQLDIPDPKEKGTNQKVTTVLFQNIQVLAVGTNFQAIVEAAGYQVQQAARQLNVTLALSSDEAGLLTFAQTNGKLQLSLRAPQEQGTETLQVASWDTLSQYVLGRQGTELVIPKSKANLEAVDDGKSGKKSSSDEEVKPFIQIFKAGQKL